MLNVVMASLAHNAKDNIIRRRCLLIVRSSAKFLWRIVFISFGIHSPCDVAYMFGSYLNGVGIMLKHRISVGVCALTTIYD